MIWTEYTKDEQLVLLQTTAADESIIEQAVEKDWWVTACLHALSKTEVAEYLTFKGGTSLSKGWNIIKRFSEDIDISINRSFYNLPENNDQQRRKIKRQNFHYIEDTLVGKLKDQVQALGISNFNVEFASGTNSTASIATINVVYESILEEKNSYIEPLVKIEIGAMSLVDPYETIELKTLINSHFDTVDNELTTLFKTVVPGRTFLEKIFLLNEEFQKDIPRSNRMSRHLYDLTNLMDHENVLAVFKDAELYKTIVKHRSVFNKIAKIDYLNNHPTKLNCCPPKQHHEAWKSDYQEMIESFIYEESPLEFSEIISKVEEIQERLFSLAIEMDFLEK